MALASGLAVLSFALGGASCDKKSVAKPTDPGPAVPFESPAKGEIKAEQAKAPEAPKKYAPTPGPEERFAELAEKLPSPCGKAESLKRSLASDPGCKSGPFARRFVEQLVRADAPDEEAETLYRNRFGARQAKSFTLRETPFFGSPNAPVVIVEFYDYACPHCREAAPVLAQVVAEHEHDVTLYFKQYPLHRESVDLARGALAAQRQGKFKDVHEKLFEATSREDVMRIAEQAGLDMARFKKDYDDPALTARINADKEEGQRANVQGTPTIFINDRQFIDMLSAERMGDWIEEDLALGR